ncbi:MAG: hypothetical protein ACRDHL_05280 [Candidatus Promineifilaceae bacterium]
MAESEISKLQGQRTVAINEPRQRQIEDVETPAAEHAAALARIKAGLATKVRIFVSYDSCPACKKVEGAFAFEAVPALPVEGCSHPSGCRCKYAPVLDLYGP